MKLFEEDAGGAFSKLVQLSNFGMGEQRKSLDDMIQTFPNFGEVSTGIFPTFTACYKGKYSAILQVKKQ